MITTSYTRLRRRTRATVVLILILAIAGAVDVLAQDFQACVEQYDNAAYEEAANCFSTVAQDTSLDRDVRKEAFQYLGRASIAIKHMDQAREAIRDLLELQPPLIEINPEVESPTLVEMYYEERKSIEVPKADPGMRTLAVMDFRNYAMEDHDKWDPMQWGFASAMIRHLNGAIDLKVVDRENIQWLLKELELQRETSVIDQSTAVRMGKMMGAHAMVFGGIYTVGKRKMRLYARVDKVETGEVLLAEYVEGSQNDFFELLEKLSLQVARAVNSQLTETEIGSRTETKSLDALRAYSEGLKLLENYDYRGAYEKFQEALDFDPTYSLARHKAESLRPELASLNNSGDASGDAGLVPMRVRPPYVLHPATRAAIVWNEVRLAGL